MLEILIFIMLWLLSVTKAVELAIKTDKLLSKVEKNNRLNWLIIMIFFILGFISLAIMFIRYIYHIDKEYK